MADKIITGKADKTRTAIKDAFITLYKKSNLSNITVRKVCENAGVTRSTFYFYFQSIYDLLESIENELEEGLSTYFETYNRHKLLADDSSPYMSTSRWFAFCMENANYLTAVMGPHGDPAFEYRIRQKLKKDINSMMDSDNMPNDNLRKYIAEYMASATIALVRYWLENGSDLSPEQLAIIANIMREGAVLRKSYERELTKAKPNGRRIKEQHS